MQAVLAIAREHGQAPSWWASLSRADRALLLADYRVRVRRAQRGQG